MSQPQHNIIGMNRIRIDQRQSLYGLQLLLIQKHRLKISVEVYHVTMLVNVGVDWDSVVKELFTVTVQAHGYQNVVEEDH